MLISKMFKTCDFITFLLLISFSDFEVLWHLKVWNILYPINLFIDFKNILFKMSNIITVKRTNDDEYWIFQYWNIRNESVNYASVARHIIVVYIYLTFSFIYIWCYTRLIQKMLIVLYSYTHTQTI